MHISRRALLAACMSGVMLVAIAGTFSPAVAQSVDVRGLGAVAVDSVDVRIVSVDLTARTIVVEKGGHQWRITAPEDFGSLAALRPRDSLQMNRVESALISAAPAKSGAKPDITYDTASDNGVFGGLPTRWIVNNITATVKFTGLDAAKSTVSFVGPEGPRSIRVIDPAVLQALGNLKSGDLVTLSFSRATEFVLTPRRF